MLIDKIKERANKKASLYLNKQFGDDFAISKYYLFLQITKHTKETDKPLYDKHIAAFRYLFNLNDAEINIALWNECSNWLSEMCLEDFTKAERTFIKNAIKSNDNDIYRNINKPLITNRLILRAEKKAELKLFYKQFRVGNESVIFHGQKFKKSDKWFFLNRPFCFVLEEKETKNIVGYAGLELDEKTCTARLEYYIFAQFRKRGYCKEAVLALCKEAFSGNLHMSVETARNGVFLQKPVQIEIIRAKIRENNLHSVNTVQSCGFQFEARIHKTMFQEGVGIFDELNYYTTKEKYNNLIFE